MGQKGLGGGAEAGSQARSEPIEQETKLHEAAPSRSKTKYQVNRKTQARRPRMMKVTTLVCCNHSHGGRGGGGSRSLASEIMKCSQRVGNGVVAEVGAAGGAGHRFSSRRTRMCTGTHEAVTPGRGDGAALEPRTGCCCKPRLGARSEGSAANLPSGVNIGSSRIRWAARRRSI